MDNIPPLGWAAIIVIAVIFLSINVSLITLLRDGPKRKSSRTVDNLRKVTGKLRSPYKEQESQMAELAELVRKYKEPEPPEKKN
jgi:hypothetical protein